MTKKVPFAFVPEGAIKRQGGSYSGPMIGFFRIWYVTGGDGVSFMRDPYVPWGWKVKKNRLNYEDRPVWYRVKRLADVEALNEFVGVEFYQGYRQTVAKDT